MLHEREKDTIEKPGAVAHRKIPKENYRKQRTPMTCREDELGSYKKRNLL